MKNLKIAYFLAMLTPLMIAISCKKDTPAVDPCAAISCQNGGTCLNGGCSCPTGYEGPACEKQKTPKALIVKKVTITKFPVTLANGGSWDVGSGPDIYPAIAFGSTYVWEAATYQNNATQGSYSFTPNPFVRITDLSQKYSIECWDYDNPPIDPDDYMGGIEGKLYGSTAGFPTKITFSCTGCDTAFEIEVEYEF